MLVCLGLYSLQQMVTFPGAKDQPWADGLFLTIRCQASHIFRFKGFVNFKTILDHVAKSLISSIKTGVWLVRSCPCSFSSYSFMDSVSPTVSRILVINSPFFLSFSSSSPRHLCRPPPASTRWLKLLLGLDPVASIRALCQILLPSHASCDSGVLNKTWFINFAPYSECGRVFISWNVV